jgi:D-glycero-beta-D-manno-heptose 1-phosphate adenylyltransferase
MSKVNNLAQKIFSADTINSFVMYKKLLSKRIAFTNGCFDILHAGHIHSLTQAAQFADVLIVGLNSDSSTKNLKGEGRPFNNQEDRAAVLAALQMVDAVVYFDEPTPLHIIEQIKPNVLVKGGDYTIETIVGAREVIAEGGKVEIIPLIAGLSTTILSEKISKL